METVNGCDNRKLIKEIVHKYREFVYETGAVDAGKRASIDQKIVAKERRRKYKVNCHCSTKTATYYRSNEASKSLYFEVASPCPLSLFF